MFDQSKVAVGGSRRTPACSLATVLLAALIGQAGAVTPDWWPTLNGSPKDYAAANVGQLKNMALHAQAHLSDTSPSWGGFPGGPGSEIDDLIASWNPTANSANGKIVLVGQLKHVSSLFYDRLIEQGFVDSYPWTATTTDDNDFGPANLGQLKNLFSFDVNLDSDGDGLPDMWEEFNGFDPSNAADGGLTDTDGDGLSNQGEMKAGSDPFTTEPHLDLLDEIAYKEVEGPTRQLSGASYCADSHSIFAIQNSSANSKTGRKIFEYSVDGRLIREIATSLQDGLSFEDPEAICWIGGGTFVIADEQKREIIEVEIYGNGRRHPKVYKLGSETVTLNAVAGSGLATSLASNDNHGLEGLAYNPSTGNLIGALEGDSIGNGMYVFEIDRSTGLSTELFDAQTLLFGSGYGQLEDIAGLSYCDDMGWLYVLSEASQKVVIVTLAGVVVGEYSLAGDGSASSFAQPEGIAIVNDAPNFVIVGEGHDFGHYSLPLTADLLIQANR